MCHAKMYTTIKNLRPRFIQTVATVTCSSVAVVRRDLQTLKHSRNQTRFVEVRRKKNVGEAPVNSHVMALSKEGVHLGLCLE